MHDSLLSGVCPKCGSGDVHTRKSIPLRVYRLNDAGTHRYVCLGCGYMEFYVQLTDKQKEAVRQGRHFWRQIGSKPRIQKRKSKRKNDES